MMMRTSATTMSSEGKARLGLCFVSRKDGRVWAPHYGATEIQKADLRSLEF